MGARAAITILKPRDEVERRWRESDYARNHTDATVSFREAPGDRGTEVYIDLGQTVPGGKVGEALAKAIGKEPRAKAMDDLRRFKQLLETGVIARSDATPPGELAERKLKQRPAQPRT